MRWCVAKSKAAQYTSPRRASCAAITVPVPTWLHASASSVETAAQGVLAGKASPFTAHRPMRRPVKLPGPAQTPNRSISAQVLPAALSTASTVGSRVSLWVRPVASVCSHSSVSFSSRATLMVRPAVSMPRIVKMLPPLQRSCGCFRPPIQYGYKSGFPLPAARHSFRSTRQPP